MEAAVDDVVDDDVANDRSTLSLSLWEFQEAIATTPTPEDMEAEEAMVSGLFAADFFFFIMSTPVPLTSSLPSSGEFILSSFLSPFMTVVDDSSSLPFLSSASRVTPPRIAFSSSIDLFFLVHFVSCS